MTIDITMETVDQIIRRSHILNHQYQEEKPRTPAEKEAFQHALVKLISELLVDASDKEEFLLSNDTAHGIAHGAIDCPANHYH